MYKEIIGVLQGEMIAGYQDGKRNELQASAMHALHHVDNRVDQKVKTLTRFVQPDGKLAKLAKQFVIHSRRAVNWAKSTTPERKYSEGAGNGKNRRGGGSRKYLAIR